MIKKSPLILLFFLWSAGLSAQISWIKYSDGPVLPRDTTYFPPSNDLFANSDPWVIKLGSTYCMWYTCAGGNYPTDTLLRSRICYCTSTDGINWTRYTNNPVIDVDYSGQWDSLGVETITVIIDSTAPPSARYKAWYAGQYFNDYRYDIGYAWSADGLHWTKHNLPVLTVGSSGAWDNAFLEGPSVLLDGNTYKMWYAGYDAIVDGQSSDGCVNIGYATSVDGINWSKYAGNPVLSTSLNGWDMLYVQDPHVIKKDGQYHLWYGGVDTSNLGGYGQQTGYATSNDGINWSKYAGNPILSRGNDGTWDHNLASFPSVLFDDDGTLKMWYTGRDKDSLPANLDYYWETGLAIDSSGFLSMAAIENSILFEIFPNPATHLITVRAPGVCNERIQFYNVFGLLIKEVLFNHSETLDISDLQQGLYLIRLKNNPRFQTKFIKI